MDPLAAAEQAKHDVLLQMQFEALSKGRKEEIVTTEFKDHRSFAPLNPREGPRLVNKAGTKESEPLRGKENALSKWNNAWTSMRNDGTADEDEADVGSGIGQTHRLKLLGDPSIKVYSSKESTRKTYGADNRARSGGAGRFPLSTGCLSPQYAFLPPSMLNGSLTFLRVAINEVRIGGRTVRTGRKAKFKSQEDVTYKPAPNGALMTSNGRQMQARQTSPLSEASTGIRRKDVATLSKVAESAARQGRLYGGTITLSSPQAFLASVRSNEPSATLEAPHIEMAANAPSSVAPNSAISITDTGSSDCASDKTPYPIKPSEARLSPPVLSQGPRPPQAKTAVDLMDLDMGQSSPLNQQKSQPAPAHSPTSLSAFLPALKNILPAEQYAMIEVIAGKQRTSTPLPQPASTPLVEALGVPPNQSANRVLKQPAAEPAINGPVQSAAISALIPSAPKAENLNALEMDGIPVENAVDKRLELCHEKEDQGYIRCRILDCTKRFRDQNFWQDHVATRHSEWLGTLQGIPNSDPPQRLKATSATVTAPMITVQDNARTDLSSMKERPASRTDATNTREDPTLTQSKDIPSNIEAVNKTVEPVSVNMDQVASVPSSISSTPALIPKTTNSAATVKPPLTAVVSGEDRRSYMERFSRQREAIIGEHISKTRFQPASVLVDKFANMTISETTVNALSNKTTNSPPKATSNPFGVSKAAAIRPISPALPSNLQKATFADPGAAARAQYGGLVERDMPVAGAPRPLLTSRIAQEATAPSFPSRSTPRAQPPAGSRPSLPAFLQGASPLSDLGAAARQQYGGENLDPLNVARKRGM
ncbi:MAG: hypothetical protein Q9163_002111 [Psora crenata]